MPTDDPILSAIESAVAEMPRDDAPADPPPADPPADPPSGDPPPAVEPPAKTPEQIEEDELKTLEGDIVKKTPGIDKGKISTSRHQAVLTRQRGIWEKQQAAAIEEALKPFAQYKDPTYAERLKVAELAEQDPDRFFEYVLDHPKYKTAVERVIGARVAKHVPAPPPPTAVDDPFKDVPTAMPEPDEVDPGTGALRYSAKAQRDLIAYQAAQMSAPLRKQLEDLQKSLQPIQSEREVREAQQAAVTNMASRLQQARAEWPGFKDMEDKIAEFVHAPGNEKATLEQAYRTVYDREMNAKIAAATADAAKLRAEVEADVIKKMNERAKGTPQRVAPGTPPPPSKGDEERDPVEDAIRTSMRTAGLV